MKNVILAIIGTVVLSSCTVYVDGVEPVYDHRVYVNSYEYRPYVNREYGPRYGSYGNPYQRRYFERCGYHCVR